MNSICLDLHQSASSTLRCRDALLNRSVVFTRDYSNKHMENGPLSWTHLSCFQFTYRGGVSLHTAPFIKQS